MGKQLDLERVFDMVIHMRENEKQDYDFDKGIKLTYKQQGIVLRKSIQAYMQGVGVKHEDKIIQAFSGSSDLPQLTKDVFNVTGDIVTFDTFWQSAFKGIQLKKGQLAWEIADVASGLVFSLVPEGGKAKFYGISGAVVDAKIAKYGAGIGITWEMIEGRKLYQFVDLMSTTRAKLNNLWADIHYGLLGVASATNQVTYQGVAAQTQLERDILTINKVYETIGEACKDKGYGDTANMPMVLYASPNLKGRITSAVKAGFTDLVKSNRSSVQTMNYNVVPYYSWNSSITAATFMMALPGAKSQNAAYIQELSLTERDIETLSDLRTYWSMFGAIIADTDQHAEGAMSS